MNKGLFKLIFNKRTGQLTPTWEGAPSQGKSGAASRAAALLLTLMMFAEPVLANPSGATVVNGSVGFNQSGNTLTITNSPNAIINWQSFSINKDEITRFIQQNGASAVLNRVTGQDPSKILGTLQSNGRVFIINPNGIVFGQGSVVDVAGLVASTLKMSDSDFLNGKYNFSNGENAGAIQNQGSITTATGGQVYLIAPNIENSGVITSPKGEIILAAGHTVSLVDPKNPDIVVSLTAPATSAVNVGQMIAEGGGVGIFAGLIKQSGLISANSASVDESGQVYLKGAQSVTLDAGSVISADNGAGAGGNVTVLSDGTTEFNGTITARGVVQGGFVETSGEHVTIGDTARVDTRAANGNNGTWLIDPADFIIASSGGNISGATLSAMLATTNASFQSSGGVNASGNGDIIVNDNVSWSTNNLTLTAARDVQVNAVMTASGDASLTINTATANGADAAVNGGTLRMGFNPDGTFKGRIDYSSMGSLTINGDEYIVVNNFTDLQTTGENLAGFYALGSNIAGGAFTPLGDIEIPFTGKFDGLGHTISNLTIDLPGGDGVGLYGYAQGAEIRNVGLVNATIVGGSQTAILAGSVESGVITNSFATGSVTSGDNTNFTGGLVGLNRGNIDSSWADVVVSTGSYTFISEGGRTGQVGGLVGNNSGLITNSYATGDVSGGSDTFAIGGLAGSNTGTIRNSYATGGVYGGGGAYAIGGLVGSSTDTSLLFLFFGSGGTIENSYATGQVDADQFAGAIGGLIGLNNGVVMNSYASGAVNTLDGVYSVGGLAGINMDDFGVGGVIANSYATGNVTTDFDALDVGGLVGTNTGAYGGMITNSYATGNVRTEYDSGSIGGLVGINEGTISNSYAMGTVSHFGGCSVEAANCFAMGGLVGINDGTIDNSDATGPVTGLGISVGGLVGDNSGVITNSDASGAVTTGNSAQGVGGLVGSNAFSGVIVGNTASGNVTVGDNGQYVGGLVGFTQSSDGGFIANNAASGNVSVGIDTVYVGGLVGFNQMQITDSSATGSVTSMGCTLGEGLCSGSIGGLAGYNSDLISGATASGTVSVGMNVESVGGLVGLNVGTVQQSSASGAVFADEGSVSIGGLVGSNIGFISYSNATGNVSGAANANAIGGLVGNNTTGEGGGQISFSSASGDVMAGTGSMNVGGLVGRNSSFSDIQFSFATGFVFASDSSAAIGGLIGLNEGGLFQSYATGAVRGGVGSNNIGGLVGTNDANGLIDNSFATGSVVGEASSQNVGGFVGSNNGSIFTSYSIGYVQSPSAMSVGGFAGSNLGLISDSYWNTESSGFASSAGGLGLTTAEMMSEANFAGFDFIETWTINEGTSLPYQQILFPGGVQVFSGTVANYDPTTLQKADLSVGGDAFGVGATSLSQVGLGANGFYYHFLSRDQATIDNGIQYQVNLINGSQLATYVGISDGADAINLDTAVNALVNVGMLNFSDTTITRLVDNLGTLSLNGGVTFTNDLSNSGTLNVNNGAMVVLSGGGSFTGITNVGSGATLDLMDGTFSLGGQAAQINSIGEINVASNATLSVTDYANQGAFGGTFNNAGNVTVNSGLFNVSADGVDSGTYFISGLSTLEFSGVRTWMDGASFTGGNLTISGTVNNNGTVDLFRNIAGDGILNNNGVINVSGVDATRTYFPTFNNVGTLNLIGSTIDVYTLVLANTTSNEGTIRVGEMATLSVPGGYTNNGLISGKGSIDVLQGALINNGTISPGASPGTLTINGNLVLSSTGNLLIELAGTTPGLFDVLNVNGTATLNGTVNVVQFDPNFVSVFGDVFTFLNAQGGLTGTFANVVSPSAFTVALGSSATSVNLITQQLTSLTPPLSPFVDPSVFIDPSGVPNTGSLTGAGNNAGTNPSQPSTTTFNALLEGAPTAAIGGNGDGGSGEVLSELYLGEPVRGDNLDARLLCR